MESEGSVGGYVVVRMNAIEEENAALKAELAAAQKEAERLAFVESRAYVGVNPHTKTCLWVLRGIYELPGQGFRAAIDKEMGEMNEAFEKYAESLPYELTSRDEEVFRAGMLAAADVLKQQWFKTQDECEQAIREAAKK